MTDRDPDRIPAAPLGYLRSQASVRLGSCDRCGATVEVSSPQAKELHERYHQSLRVLWVAAQNGDGGGDARVSTSTTSD
jgi:hypothetical protein